MNKSITDYIVKRLFRAASEDDVVYSVCQKTGLGWEDAQALVEQVKDEHLEEIDAKQIPVKSALSFVFLVLGIILMVGPVIYLWIMLDVTQTLLVFIANPTSVSAETVVKLIVSRCALLGWFQLPSIIFTMWAGLGIVIANLRYVSGIWKDPYRK